MDKNLTDIVLLVDRTGSMGVPDSKRSEAEKAVNQFIEEQKQQEGKCNLTLVEFNTETVFIHNREDIQKVGEYKLIPGGMTALVDAVGKTIDETGDRLRETSEDQRPGVVVFVVMTDGEENSSREYSKHQIKEMKQKQEEDYNWKFVFLGSDIDAFNEGGSLGMSGAGTLGFRAQQVGAALKATSHSVSEVRYAASAGEDKALSFTDKQRKEVSES